MTVHSARTGSDSTAARIADEIRRRLTAGAYVPGQRLIESELAGEFAVSRGPVREALSRLSAEGFLVLERNRGAVVRRMTLEDIEELYHLREVLEGAAASLAAKRIDERGNRERMRHALTANRELSTVGHLPEYVAHNEAFHQLIVDLAGSSLLAETIAAMRTRAFRLQFGHLATSEAISRSAAQHEMVGDAILAGNPADAEKCMREHVRLSGGEVLERFRAEQQTGRFGSGRLP